MRQLIWIKEAVCVCVGNEFCGRDPARRVVLFRTRLARRWYGSTLDESHDGIFPANYVEVVDTRQQSKVRVVCCFFFLSASGAAPRSLGLMSVLLRKSTDRAIYLAFGVPICVCAQNGGTANPIATASPRKGGNSLAAGSDDAVGAEERCCTIC